MQRLLIKIIFILIDLGWLILLFYISNFIRNLFSHYGIEYNVLQLEDFIFAIVIILLLFIYEKIYDFRFDFWQETLKVFKAIFLSFLIVLSLLALSKTNFLYSRLFILIYFTLALITFPFFKRFIKRVLFSFSFFKEKLLVVGKNKEKLIKELKENWYLGLEYSDKEYSKVIIISNSLAKEELAVILDKYLTSIREVYIVPYLENVNFVYSNILEYSNIRCNLIQIENKLLIRKNIFLKTFTDKLISIFILPLFIILHIFIYILIKLDSKGKIFFIQERLSKDGRVFKIYKYRTMYEDSENLLNEYLKTNPSEIEYYKKYHKYKYDPRITKIGSFLRKTSLDELPQVINVIKGEMSIVGPRPYMLDEKDKLINKNIILRVKPGITGLWQVSGRNELTFNQRVELETWYIRNWSLWLDIIILFKTIKVVFNKKGAQ